ncbi:hypothetical protein FQN55_002879 [Onygenales sp. PD_40]|nr:hypothetical protein FQN55_002879 [Onygenales sp. PD_40]
MKSKTPSIPSKHSLLTSPTLLPPQTTSYPTITHCNLLSCTFDSLTPSTFLSHAYMRHTTIKSPPPPPPPPAADTDTDTLPSSPSGKPSTTTTLSESSHITHAKIAHSTISASRIEQSDIRTSTISRAEFISQTKCIDSTISGTGRIEQCKIKNSRFLPTTTATTTTTTAAATAASGGVGNGGGSGSGSGTAASSMHHSSVQGSTIGEACVIVHCKLRDVRVARSVVRNARVEDCDVEGCEIEGGSFSGLWLRNGVWRGDELVGRVRVGEEVVVKARGFAEIEERERGGGGMVAELDGGGLVELPGGVSAVRDFPYFPSISATSIYLTNHPPQSTPNHPQIPHLQFTDFSIPSLSSTLASAPTASPAYEPNPAIQIPPSKEPHIGMGVREHTPASPSSDGYSSATGLVDEDREFTHVDQREMGLLEKAAAPPPYEP